MKISGLVSVSSSYWLIMSWRSAHDAEICNDTSSHTKPAPLVRTTCCGVGEMPVFCACAKTTRNRMTIVVNSCFIIFLAGQFDVFVRFYHVDGVVAQFLAVADDVHIIDTALVAIFLVVHIGHVHLFELRAVAIDFIFNV